MAAKISASPGLAGNCSRSKAVPPVLVLVGAAAGGVLADAAHWKGDSMLLAGPGDAGITAATASYFPAWLADGVLQRYSAWAMRGASNWLYIKLGFSKTACVLVPLHPQCNFQLWP